MSETIVRVPICLRGSIKLELLAKKLVRRGRYRSRSEAYEAWMERGKLEDETEDSGSGPKRSSEIKPSSRR